MKDCPRRAQRSNSGRVHSAAVSSLLMFVLFWGVLLEGCPRGTSQEDAGELKTLLEPFDPPTLEELNAKVQWEDSPVRDAMEMLREKMSHEPPLVPVSEALQMRNNSDEDNTKILSALGQPWKSLDEVQSDTEINRHLHGDFTTVNPLLASTVSDVDVQGLTNIGFFSFDWNMEPFAPKETVVSWQTSQDKLYDKIVMRDDLLWSDGVPITAHDVKFSFETIMNPDIPIPAARTGMETVRWVEAYDDHTFVIFHKESLATNVWNCNFPIIPKHIYEKSIADDLTLVESDYHQKFEQNPVVGGPYKLVKRIKGQEVILERRDDWSTVQGKQVRQPPIFKTVRFRVIEDTSTAQLALVRGQIDEMELRPVQWVEQTNDDAFYERNTKVRGEQWVYFHFGWNLKRDFFEDVRVRKAMSYAVNYDYILNTLCYGLYPRCTSEFPPQSWCGPLKPRVPYEQNLELAGKLLDEAGWTDTDKDGIRDRMINGRKVNFDFTILCRGEQLRIDICTSLAESLNRLGIVCHVQPLEFTVLQQRLMDHDFDANFGGWGTGTDPSTTSNIFKTGEQRNYGQYSNPKVDELFDKARVELDQAKRAVDYREIDDILWDDQPYTWLYYQSAFYAFNKSLRGYKFSPRGPYHYSPGFESLWPAKH